MCEDKPAVAKCKICGREVCEDHIADGICSVCRDLMVMYKGKLKPAVGRCPFCGRLICRECSVEIEPGVRVCKDCFQKLDEYFRKYPVLRGCYSRYLRVLKA